MSSAIFVRWDGMYLHFYCRAEEEDVGTNCLLLGLDMWNEFVGIFCGLMVCVLYYYFIMQLFDSSAFYNYTECEKIRNGKDLKKSNYISLFLTDMISFIN